MSRGRYFWDDLEVELERASMSGATLTTFRAPTVLPYLRHTANDALRFSRQIPHRVAVEEGELRPHIHWSQNGTAAGNVVWQLEYTLCNPFNVFPAATSIKSVAVAPQAQYTHEVTPLPHIGIPVMKESLVIVCVLTRPATADADDTLAQGVWASSFDFHAPFNKQGTEHEYEADEEETNAFLSDMA